MPTSHHHLIHTLLLPSPCWKWCFTGTPKHLPRERHGAVCFEGLEQPEQQQPGHLASAGPCAGSCRVLACCSLGNGTAWTTHIIVRLIKETPSIMAQLGTTLSPQRR